jgi:hypothetical protein
VRLVAPATILAVVAVLAGCGDSSDQTTTEGPSAAKQVQSAWEREPSCKRPKGASRWGCSVGAYRCQGVVTGRGWSISCAKPGRSIAWVIPRD